MLVIEGASKKSVRVNELFKEFKGKSILIVDTVNTTKWWGENASVIAMSIEDMKGQLASINSLIILEEYDIIVFYVNDKHENLDWYKKAENFINKPIIVTIQNNELNDIKEYIIK